MDETIRSAAIPMKWVGPIRISGNVAETETAVPLATFETPLWPSVARGAKLSMAVARGIVTTLVDERMTRSILLEAEDGPTAFDAVRVLRRGSTSCAKSPGAPAVSWNSSICTMNWSVT